MANGARRTSGVCAALLGLALLMAASAEATHTVSVRVFVGPVALLEEPGGYFSRYGFDYRVHAEVRGAPACESWSLSVSGADGGAATAQGGARQALAGRGTVAPGSFAELVGSASCTAQGHRADGSSETTYAVAPPKPEPETPSPPSRLLDGDATGELRMQATRSTGLALLACSTRSARRSRRLKPLLDVLCRHGALAAFASPLVGGTSGSGSPVPLPPRVGVPAASALKRLCRQRRGRACSRLVRAAGAYLEASSRSTGLIAALGATAVRFGVSQESQDGLWAHAASGRVYAGRLGAALAEERVRARALARALRRARLTVRLSRVRVGKATRRFERLRLLPRRALGRYGVGADRQRARSLLGLQLALGPAHLDLRKLLVTGGGSERLQAYARSMTAPMVLGLAGSVLSESGLPFDAPARVAFDRELRRLALLCEPAERAAALTGAVAAAGALPGTYAAHLAAAAAAVPPIAPPARPAGCPEPLSPPAGLRLQFGGFGTGPGEFDLPTDVAVGPGGVYVADQLNSRIQRFAPDGRYLGQWGGRPLGDVAPGPGQFLLPVGVAQAADGSVYVSDFGANRVQRFTADGAFVREWGGQGADDGEFDGMTGLTVDRDGFVYVADARNGRVQKFTADGAFVLKFGTRGTGSGQFSAPRGITTDAAGDVYVADRDNGRVQVYSPTGALLREWGRRGTSPGRFNGLYDVAIDGTGNVWTADLHNFRLQRFTPTGTLLGVENRFGSAPEDFDPWAVAVDAAGRIYAVDILGGTGDRILVFGP